MGSPSPSPMPQFVIRLSIGFRAQRPSIWRAWLFGKELDQAGGGRRDGQEAKCWGAKTRDSGSGCRWKTAPQPQLKFGTSSSQHASRQGFSPPLVSLKTLPDQTPFPAGSGPLWAATLHMSSQTLPLVSDQDLAPLAPSIWFSAS